MFIKLGLLLTYPTRTKAASLQYSGQSYNYTFEERAFDSHTSLLLLRSEIRNNIRYETVVEPNDKGEIYYSPVRLVCIQAPAISYVHIPLACPISQGIQVNKTALNNDIRTSSVSWKPNHFLLTLLKRTESIFLF